MSKDNHRKVDIEKIKDPELRSALKRAYDRIGDIEESNKEAAAESPLDFFFADVINPVLRDQRDTMAIPFFSLAKRKRTKPIEYKKNGVKVTVAGLTTTGIATIWDADFLIWAASQLNEAVKKGERPTRRLWVVPYHFLIQVKRLNLGRIGGKAYKEFESLLDRLQGTTVKTNIKAGGEHITKAFSWIDSWETHRDEKGRIKGVEVWLSEWFFRRVVKDKAILSITSDYFLLTGGIERWLYRIARKHCGNNDIWSFTVKGMYDKYPPGREFRKFKSDLKKIVTEDCLPEYHTFWEVKEKDMRTEEWVVFIPREGIRETRRLPRSIRNSLLNLADV